MHIPFLLCLAVLAVAGDEIRFVPAFSARFEHPLWVREIPGTPGRFLVLEQAGRATALSAGDEGEVLLDLVAEVAMPAEGNTEEGLLSLAFHPHFTDNKRIFLWYTTHRAGRLQSVLVRRTLGSDRAETLLTLDQPYPNHNGGDLHFGADGRLYLSVGDGGSGGDPQNRAQNLGSLFGKILRLDVDHPDGGNPYSVPKDNPFVGKAGARPEIWAYGLRNPWRMSFDPPTGELWAGDVGQNLHEEVDIIVKGGNYGWNLREGFSAYNGGAKAPGMIDPVHDYPRDQGVSVTGGWVYRGAAIPALQGAYIFADWGSRRIWSLRREGGRSTVRHLAQCPGQPSSFGVDAAGELLVCSFDGRVYRIVAP